MIIRLIMRLPWKVRKRLIMGAMAILEAHNLSFMSQGAYEVFIRPGDRERFERKEVLH